MHKKILAFFFLLCLSMMNNCFAEEWVNMGLGVKFEHLPADQVEKWGYYYYYDADTMVVNHERKYVEITYMTSNKSVLSNTGSRNFDRRRFYFADDPRRCGEVQIAGGNYDFDAKRANYLFDFRNKPESFFQISRCDMSIDNGEYYRNHIFYKEFAALFNLPNQDGTEYITPKSLGLTWINSTAEEGVFYKAESVKAKDTKVTADIYIWLPNRNRIEKLSGIFDYSKNVFKPTKADFYRINTGEHMESYKKGLLGGLLGGTALRTFRFDEDDGIAIAAEFFKSKLAE